ncbi:hypothetical protein RTBOTA2_000788 [Rhodotorula toruloides]|nr:hypothetical protein RTBOTA2_000788 [Rhodotorula toruloides]
MMAKEQAAVGRRFPTTRCTSSTSESGSIPSLRRTSRVASVPVSETVPAHETHPHEKPEEPIPDETQTLRFPPSSHLSSTNPISPSRIISPRPSRLPCRLPPSASSNSSACPPSAICLVHLVRLPPLASICLVRLGPSSSSFLRWSSSSLLFFHHPERAMRVEIVVDPARAAAKQPLTARIAAAAPQAPANSRAAQSATVAAAGGSAVQTRQPRQPGQEGRRGGRRGGGRGGARGSERPKVTAESLDAEMSDYQAQGAGANGAEASA